MTQQITLLGASYSDVPAVTLPKTGGGTASFTDVTDTTAGANDVAAGKYFYTAAGVKTEGTSTGGSPTLITKSITANGTYNASSDSADGYSSVTVNVSGGGGGGDMSDPIRFFDYDGTLVASYSSVPASLPTCPSHTGMTSQGWNYTIAEVTAQFNAMGLCDVGHSMVTSDGKTRIYIELHEGRTSPYVGFCPKGSVEIDWGDGSSTDTLTGTSLTTAKHKQHNYAAPGKYTITLTPASGTTFALYGTSNNAYILTKTGGSQGSVNQVYNSAVKTIEFGNSVSIGQYAFHNLRNVEYMNIPTSITEFPSTNHFSSMYSLKFIAYPRGTTDQGYGLGSLYSLKAVSLPSTLTTFGRMSSAYDCERIVIPNGVTTISAANGLYMNSQLTSIVLPSSLTALPASALSSNNALASLTIPASVTTIGNSAFGSNYGMKEYHFLRTESVPTLDNVNAFSNIQSDCVIYVPSSKLNDYKTAENWATYASYMVGE